MADDDDGNELPVARRTREHTHPKYAQWAKNLMGISCQNHSIRTLNRNTVVAAGTPLAAVAT